MLRQFASKATRLGSRVAFWRLGVYWKPVWHILEGHFVLILANAAHVKTVPGRKSDVNDATWLADLVILVASLGGIRPIPTQVDRRRRRHSRGGHDGAQCDTVKGGPVVGLRDPRPDGPHDRGRFHGYSAAPAHCDMGPAGCDASMSKSDVPGSDHDTSMPACDVTGSGDASMPNRDVPGSDGGTLMSNYGVTGHRDTFT